MAAGKFAEAAIEYKNAVQKDALAGNVRVKLADASFASGDLGAALREYVRAADLLPDDLALQLKAGNFLLVAGRYDDARVRAGKIVAKQPRHVEAQILLASSLAGTKELDKALAQIEDALTLAPDRSGSYSTLGAIELSRGKRDAAEQAFKKAVELDPRSVAAHLALGNFYWLTARMADAERELERALELEPSHVLTNRAVANFYLATKRLAEAERPLKAVYELTKSGEAALALEDYYAATGQDAAARQMLQPMLGDPRSSTTASVRLATLDHKDGRHAEAYERLTTVLEKDQANLQALLARFAFQTSDGLSDGALATAKIAVQRHPESAAAFYALGRAQSVLRQPLQAIAAYQEVLRLNPRATDAKIALGLVQLSQGRPAASIGLAAEALANEPLNGDAQLLYARGLLAQGELPRAERELAELAARFPNSAAVRVQMGMLLGRRGRLADAREEFDRAAALAPGDLEALGGLVALDLAARNYTSARARIDARIASGVSAPLLTLAARTYAASSDFASAERFLRQAIDLDNGYVAAYGALGQLYLAQGRLDSARAEFEALAQRTPTSIAAQTMVGVILQSQGNVEGAREQFERALQIDPDAALAANNLAWIYAEHGGNLDVAMNLAQTAQKRLPAVAEVSDTLGFIYYKKNLPALAISMLNVSAAQDPANAVYQYHLGLAYASAGDAVRARAALARALSLKSDFHGAEHAKSLLVATAIR